MNEYEKINLTTYALNINKYLIIIEKLICDLKN